MSRIKEAEAKIVIGAGYGDEGKGRMTDYFAKSYIDSNDEDASTIHKMTTFGICVLDPTRTMSIIPAILQG